MKGQMEGKRLLKSLRLQNFLSFGSKAEEIKLEPLNVLIGRNASGKSNLIEALELLRAAPTGLANRIREGGGIGEFLWKGRDARSDGPPIARIDTVVDYPEGVTPLRHKITFTMISQRVQIVEETIEREHLTSSREKNADFFYRYQEGQATVRYKKLNEHSIAATARTDQMLSKGNINMEESILSQRYDPHLLPEITYLRNTFSKMKLYGELNLGPGTAAEFPQKADLPDDYLLEDASNLGMVLDDLSQRLEPMNQIMENLKDVYNEAERISTRIRGGTVQVFVYETGMIQPIPATCLSDGTLRYLCLLTLLCHPEPPPLLCIEEPELGLHPDILPTIAKLLVEASKNTQLIVTTHSDALVSALSHVPECILVCERDYDGTHLRRLEPKKLKEWLKKYSLGDLWRMGEIGGTRW